MSLHPTDDRLDAFVLHDLDDESQREVEVHLRGCSRCRRKLEHLQASLKSYRTQPLPAPAGHIGERLMARAQEQGRQRRRLGIHQPWVRMLAAGTMAAGIFMMGFWTGRSGSIPMDGNVEASDSLISTQAVPARTTARPLTVTFTTSVVDGLAGITPPDTTWN